MADSCPRGSRNLRAAVLGVASEGTKETFRFFLQIFCSLSTFFFVESDFSMERKFSFPFAYTNSLRSAVAQHTRLALFLWHIFSSRYGHFLLTLLILCFCWPLGLLMLFTTLTETAEAQLRLWKRDRSSVSATSSGPPMHPNALLPRSRPK